ncbi:glycine betaine transporter membrane protein [Thermoplasmatales archaeon]|nr:glycine betaine transporter membrane protein [Thermoplasmatales archaeon]
MLSFYLLAQIVLATLATFARVGLMMFISVLISLVFGILAARVKSAESIVISLTDVMEAVPVVSFFPIILSFFLFTIKGSLGVEISADFLILTAVVWNLILGVYEAVARLPEDFENVSKVYRVGFLNRIRKIYYPIAVPNLVANIMPSFASALFYITFSEVITFGIHDYYVIGIGSLAFSLTEAGNYAAILVLVLIVIIAIALTFFLIISPLIDRSKKYAMEFVSANGQAVRKRESGAIVHYFERRFERIATSGRNVVANISKALSPGLPAEEKVKRGLSKKLVNITVGIVLLALIGFGIYEIALAGFYQAFIVYFLSPSFLSTAFVNLAYDLARIGIVYSISIFTMVPLAIFLGKRQRNGKVTTAIMQIMYSIPIPIFVPLLIVILVPALAPYTGYNLALNFEVLLVTYFSAAAYIFFNVYGAVVSIPDEFKMVARTLNLSRWQEIRSLTIPSIIPSLITGSMAAVGSYWGGLSVSEFLSINGKTYVVSHGLMASIDRALNAGNLLKTDAIDIFMVIVIIILSFALWIRLYVYAKKKYAFSA